MFLKLKRSSSIIQGDFLKDRRVEQIEQIEQIE